VAILLGLGFLAVCLGVQLSRTRYVPVVSWLAVTAVSILVPLLGYRKLGLNGVLAFWSACTVTRPLGASFADWMSVPAPYGDGLQLGTGPMSLAFGAALVAAVTYVALGHRSTRHQDEATPSSPDHDAVSVPS
jgi:uncharacterized membrane-anchored protein